MTHEEELRDLIEYFSNLSTRFVRGSEVYLPTKDEAHFKRKVLETKAVLNDVFGQRNDYVVNVMHAIRTKSGGYFGGPSVSCVEDIASILEAALHQLKRKPVHKALTTVTAASSLWNRLHPSVVKAAKSRYETGHFADAVEAAMKSLNREVKAIYLAKTGEELDGVKLMRKAFSPQNPTIRLDDLSTETGRNIQQGYMDIFAGSIAGIRNPKAHEIIEIDEGSAIHHLFLASLLFFKLEEAPESAQLNATPAATGAGGL